MPVLALLLAAAPAVVYSSADVADARCVAAFSLAVTAAPTPNDAATKQSLTIGAIFFVGKLKGRNPAVDIATLLRSVSVDAKRNLGADLQRCGGELQTSGQDMIAAGKALSADGL